MCRPNPGPTSTENTAALADALKVDDVEGKRS